MRSIRDLIAAYREGSSFTDEEILAARNHCKQAADQLVVMGDTFHLAFKEANTIYYFFKEAAKARGLKDDR